MEDTKIESAKHTFNPWIGCTNISEGCKNCYAKASEATRLHRVVWGKGQARKKNSPAVWARPHVWEKEAKESGENPIIFCASVADIFDEEVNDKWRDELFDLIKKCPSLRWCLLTKRSEKMLSYKRQIESIPHVIMGVTAENQARFDERVPDLLKIQTKRYISMEPLLGPIRMGKAAKDLHWIMLGGEATTDGISARPMHAEWVRSVRDECQAAGVPFFFKQWGGRSPAEKKHKGKLLDGKVWRLPPKGYSFPYHKPLNARNQALLEKLEKLVTEGIRGSIVAAKALWKIKSHDSGTLWKTAGYKTFQEYCKATWNYGAAHTYRLADAGQFVEDLEDSPIGEKVLPRNEAQIRPVLDLPMERRIEFWKEKIIDLGPDQITARTISKAVEGFIVEKKLPKKKKREIKPPTRRVLKERTAHTLNRLKLLTKDHRNGTAIQDLLGRVDDLL